MFAALGTSHIEQPGRFSLVLALSTNDRGTAYQTETGTCPRDERRACRNDQHWV